MTVNTCSWKNTWRVKASPDRSVQQTFGEIAYRIPDAEESDSDDCQEDKDDIPRMDADGIGVDDKRALAATQPYEAVLLLQPTKQKAK